MTNPARSSRDSWLSNPSGIRGLLLVTSVVLQLCLTALPALAQGIVVPDLPVLPSTGAAPGQKVLVIAEGDEKKRTKTILLSAGMPGDLISKFDGRPDYRPYHAVMVGSNGMDYFSSASKQGPEAFQPLVNYVAGGGHLLMFGTFHGRNMGHLERFGIKAFGGESKGFLPVSGATEALFAGMEGVVPKDNELTCLGQFRISRPHVPLLLRSGGSGSGEAAIATMAYGDGRITIMMVEPHFRSEYWLVQVIMNWHQRGAPTRLFTSGMSGLAAQEKSLKRRPLPSESSQEAIKTAIQEKYADDYQLLKPANAAVGKELSRTLFHKAVEDLNPVACFGLLVESRELAGKSGDAAGVLNAVETLGHNYQIDSLAMLQESLETCATAARSPGECRTVANVALMGAVEAISVSRTEEAEFFLTTAAANGRRARAGEIPKILSMLRQQANVAEKAAKGK